MPRSSFQWRLMTWYMGLMLAILVVTLGGVYISQDISIHTSIRLEIGEELSEYQHNLRREETNSGGIAQVTQNFFDAHIPHRGEFLVLHLPSGRVIVNRRRHLAASLLALSGSRTTIKDRKVQAIGHDWEVYVLPITIGGRYIGSYMVAKDLTYAEQPLQTLLALFVLAGGVALLMEGLVGYFITSKAISPIIRITRIAQMINREDLSRRIGYKGPHDEIGELAATFDSMVDRLERAFNEQRHFLADISHELRTPITVIRGQMEVLGRSGPPSAEEFYETRAVVLDELDRMNRLVGDLLLLARSMRQDFVEGEWLWSEPFFSEILPKLETLGPHPVVVSRMPERPFWADRQRLTQVFMNLVRNAQSVTPEGKPIEINAITEPTGMSFAVRDYGPGIPPHLKEKLFGRFVRGEGSRRDGLGLGLAIVRAIVEAHGGRIEAEDAEGGGSRFRFFLPYPQR